MNVIKLNKENTYMLNIENIYRGRTDYIKEMKKYLKDIKQEKENINMEPVRKFKEDLINVLDQAINDVVKFENSYEALIHIHERLSKMFDEVNKIDAAMMESKKVKSTSVNTYDIDLKKFNINVDEWDEHVNPIKGIISVVLKTYEGFHFEFEVGGLILLMEDGSFRMS